MSRRASPVVVGAFVMVAVVLTLIAVVVLGSGRFFQDTDEVVVYFDESVSGLSVGAPVKLMGIDVGRVDEIRVEIPPLERARGDSHVAVLLELDEQKVVVGGEVVDLDDREAVSELVDEGLRARLVTESFVTGLRYIELVFEPDAPAELVAVETAVPQIPVIPAPTQQLQQEASVALERLAEVEYAETFRSLRDAAESANDVLESPELAKTLGNLEDVTANLSDVARSFGPRGEVGRSVAQASEQSAETATAVRQLLHPEGELMAQLDATLEEVRAAARALRELAEQLSRDPGSLLRGGRQ